MEVGDDIYVLKDGKPYKCKVKPSMPIAQKFILSDSRNELTSGLT